MNFPAHATRLAICAVLIFPSTFPTGFADYDSEYAWSGQLQTPILGGVGKASCMKTDGATTTLPSHPRIAAPTAASLSLPSSDLANIEWTAQWTTKSCDPGGWNEIFPDVAALQDCAVSSYCSDASFIMPFTTTPASIPTTTPSLINPSTETFMNTSNPPACHPVPGQSQYFPANTSAIYPSGTVSSSGFYTTAPPSTSLCFQTLQPPPPSAPPESSMSSFGFQSNRGGPTWHQAVSLMTVTSTSFEDDGPVTSSTPALAVADHQPSLTAHPLPNTKHTNPPTHSNYPVQVIPHNVESGNDLGLIPTFIAKPNHNQKGQPTRTQMIRVGSRSLPVHVTSATSQAPGESHPAPALVIGSKIVPFGSQIQISGTPVVANKYGSSAEIIAGTSTLTLPLGPSESPEIDLGPDPSPSSESAETGENQDHQGSQRHDMSGITSNAADSGTLLSAIPASGSRKTTAQALVFAGSTYTEHNSVFVIGGKTLSPGGSITASGTPIYLPAGQ